MLSERFDLPLLIPMTHRVCFTRGAFADGREMVVTLLREGGGRRALVFLEQSVAEHWPKLAEEIRETLDAAGVALSALQIHAGGEIVKNDDSLVKNVWKAVEGSGIDRHSYVLCIGGGAYLDAVGFGVATAHRGVRLLRFPTTTLSQDDSGVGVKNGINCFGKKNWIGTFAVPYAVVNDFQFIFSQDVTMRQLGLIESLKVALVKDADFFRWMEANAVALAVGEEEIFVECVKRSALLHARHITTGGDAFEMGSSRPLDFGHWAAHKLEQLSGFCLSHAHAVCVGLWLDVLYSVKAGFLPEEEALRIGNVMGVMGFPQFDELLFKRDGSGTLAIVAGLEEFREHLGGTLTILLLRAAGVGVEVHSMNVAWIEECVAMMREQAFAASVS
jgi:3-dehydroquinate synthase